MTYIICRSMWDGCPERFLGIVRQDSRVSKSKWLHVDLFRVSFTKVKSIPHILLKTIGNFREVLNLDQFIYNLWSVVSIHVFVINKIVEVQYWEGG